MKINYIYFGFFFLFLTFLTFFEIETLIPTDLYSRTLFFSLFNGQLLLELLALMGLIACSAFYKRTLVTNALIGFSFVLFLYHCIDLVLIRIFDISVPDAIVFVTGTASWRNLLELLYASGFPLWFWLGVGIMILLLPFIGLIFYSFTEQVSLKKPLFFPRKVYALSFLTIGCLLFVGETLPQKSLSIAHRLQYQRILPLKKTYFSFCSAPRFSSSRPLTPPKSEKEMKEHLNNISLPPSRLPNLYLFVIESLRRDYITSAITPHLFAFQQQYQNCLRAFSNANCTHLSWFSLFHANFPHLWVRLQDAQWKIGSPPLHLLKKAGYSISVYSSSHLSFYGMSELLFGENLSLCDSFNPFLHPSSEAYEADAKVFHQLKKDLSDCSFSSGHIFIVFLDSSHFCYSYPPSPLPPFQPEALSPSLLVFSSPTSLCPLQNRYRNALHYIDSLLGGFFSFLKENHSFDPSIIAITADHGEEFFEQGHLFHASHLSPMQLQIPIFYKFDRPLDRTFHSEALTSQMDVFPTLLHYLFPQKNFSTIVEGHSLFDPHPSPFTLSVRSNWKETPYEFLLITKKSQILTRLLNPNHPYHSHGLEVLSAKREPEGTPLKDKKAIEEELSPILQKLFSRN